MKISISIDETILQMLDNYADKRRMSRSAVISKGVGELLLKEEIHDTVASVQLVCDKLLNQELLSEKDAIAFKRSLNHLANLVDYPY